MKLEEAQSQGGLWVAQQWHHRAHLVPLLWQTQTKLINYDCYSRKKIIKEKWNCRKATGHKWTVHRS